MSNLTAGDEGRTTACQVSDVCQGVVSRVVGHAWPPATVGKTLAALRDFPL